MRYRESLAICRFLAAELGTLDSFNKLIWCTKLMAETLLVGDIAADALNWL